MPLAEDLLPPARDWLSKRLRELQRSVDELRAARGSSATSFIGGAFRLLDAARAPRLVAGAVNLDGSVSGITDAYGVLVFADDGAVVLMTRQGTKGLAFPPMPLPMHSPAPAVVTSATFVNIFECGITRPSHEVYQVRGAVACDPGTVGELKLFEFRTGEETGVITLSGPLSETYSFEWKHPGTIGLYEGAPTPKAAELGFALLARRVSGAANLTVYPPLVSQFTSTLLAPNADANGNPLLVL